MYAGNFNLNTWLRTFIRSDLMDEYESKCLKVVQKYKDQESRKVLLSLFRGLNYELTSLAEKIVNEGKVKDKHDVFAKELLSPIWHSWYVSSNVTSAMALQIADLSRRNEELELLQRDKKWYQFWIK